MSTLSAVKVAVAMVSKGIKQRKKEFLLSDGEFLFSYIFRFLFYVFFLVFPFLASIVTTKLQSGNKGTM